MANPYTKYEVSSLSCSGDITCKILKRVTRPCTTPVSGRFFNGRVELALVNQPTTFEVSVHPLRSYAWRCKMQKMGWFGAVRGHARSWVMPPFDRAHTTFYLTLIGSMFLSCTVFDPVISQKSPILTHPTCIRRPRRG